MLKCIKKWRQKDKSGEIFAKGICFEKCFLIFLIASIFGTYYEQILNLVKFYISDKIFFWEIRRGVFYGPFSPVYGMGAVVMLLILGRKKLPNYKVFIYGALLGGTFEYLISYLQELFTGTISWDYSDHFLNINGRTTIPFMLAWGLVTLVFIKIIYPFLSKQIEKIPYFFGKIFVIILFVVFALDCFVSWTALIRGTMRQNEIEPLTPVGVFYDKVYPDEVLKRHFPNMSFEIERGK